MQATPECWLPIPGYESRYDVSDQGQIRSLLGRSGRPIPYMMTPCEDSKGYYEVTLSHAPNRARSKLVHLLVMLAFIGPRPDGLERRHLDGDCRNNNLANLTYGTRTENMQDRVKHGGYANAAKTHCPANHPYDEANTYFDKSGGRSCRECGRIRQRGHHRDRRAYYARKRAPKETS